MPDSELVNKLSATDESEIKELWDRWAAGRLDDYRGHLFTMIEENRDHLLREIEADDDLKSIILGLKSAIAKIGTVELRAEQLDQLREIHNEIWYQGERENFDRKKIVLDWTEKHAEKWRRWRIKEYLFVVDRCEREIALKLKSEVLRVVC